MNIRVLAALAILLAGCATTQPTTAPTDATPATTAADQVAKDVTVPSAPSTGPRPPTRLYDACDKLCEPSVTVDGKARLVVTETMQRKGGYLAVIDGNGTVARVAYPPTPSGTTADAFQQDNLVQTDSQGRLVFSAMVSDWFPNGQHAYFNTVGLQVAVSPDSGRTWSSNVLVTIPALAAPLHDRQWLAFGPDNVMYLVFQQIPTGIWAARSDDGGSTFQTAMPVATHADRLYVRASGLPAVDHDGRLVVPYFAVLDPTTTDTEASATVRIAVSTDKGLTFTQTIVAVEPSDHGAWPTVVADDGNGLHLSWASATEGVLVAHSADHGATWTAATAWVKEGVIPEQTWMATTPQKTLLVAWYAKDGNGHVLRLARGGANYADPQEEAITMSPKLAGGQPSTDFPNFTVMADGTVASVWGETDAGVTLGLTR
ncbi:MAG: sialidase family protein [bacterium]